MQQEQLWHDSLSDAVRSLVEALADEDQRDQLQREFIAAQRGMKALLKRMEALT